MIAASADSRGLLRPLFVVPFWPEADGASEGERVLVRVAGVGTSDLRCALRKSLLLVSSESTCKRGWIRTRQAHAILADISRKSSDRDSPATLGQY